MPFPRSSRLASALVSGAAAGLTLTAVGCGHVAPLGPDGPQPHQLRSPIVLQAMSVQSLTTAGGCPAGFTRLSAPGQSPACYRPVGAPVTITSAAVGPGPTTGPTSPANAPPTEYGLLITVPPADRAELTAVTTQATDSQGAVDISVVGKTWGLLLTQAPLTDGWFTITLPSHNEVVQLQHILTASD